MDCNGSKRFSRIGYRDSRTKPKCSEISKSALIEFMQGQIVINDSILLI